MHSNLENTASLRWKKKKKEMFMTMLGEICLRNKYLKCDKQIENQLFKHFFLSVKLSGNLKGLRNRPQNFDKIYVNKIQIKLKNSGYELCSSIVHMLRIYLYVFHFIYSLGQPF